MALWTVHKPKLISISFAKEAETNNNNESNGNKPRSIGENHFWLSADCCFHFANDEPTTRLENLIFWLPLVETEKCVFRSSFPELSSRWSSSTFGRMLCSNCMTNSCQLSHTFRALSLPASLAYPPYHPVQSITVTHTHTHDERKSENPLAGNC